LKAIAVVVNNVQNMNGYMKYSRSISCRIYLWVLHQSII